MKFLKRSERYFLQNGARTIDGNKGKPAAGGLNGKKDEEHRTHQ